MGVDGFTQKLTIQSTSTQCLLNVNKFIEDFVYGHAQVFKLWYLSIYINADTCFDFSP